MMASDVDRVDFLPEVTSRIFVMTSSTQSRTHHYTLLCLTMIQIPMSPPHSGSAAKHWTSFYG